MPRKFRLSEYVKRKRMNTSSEPRQKKSKAPGERLEYDIKGKRLSHGRKQLDKMDFQSFQTGENFTYCPDDREDIFIYFSYLEENYRKSKISSENFCVSKLLRTLVATPT